MDEDPWDSVKCGLPRLLFTEDSGMNAEYQRLQEVVRDGAPRIPE